MEFIVVVLLSFSNKKQKQKIHLGSFIFFLNIHKGLRDN